MTLRLRSLLSVFGRMSSKGTRDYRFGGWGGWATVALPSTSVPGFVKVFRQSTLFPRWVLFGDHLTKDVLAMPAKIFRVRKVVRIVGREQLTTGPY